MGGYRSPEAYTNQTGKRPVGQATRTYPGQNPAGYFKDDLGVVHLRGVVTCPTKADPQIPEVYLLPEGYKASVSGGFLLFVMSFANTSDPLLTFLRTNPSG